MFNKSFFLLLANFAIIINGIPLESAPEHDMKQFLNTRIVGGVDAPPEYGHHMAALVFGEITTHLACGASIITKQHVLSAAHCIEPMVVWGQLMRSFRAVIGSNKWTSTQNSISFKDYITHPLWSWDTIKNDIGVLFLAEDIKLNENVAIIPLDYNWSEGGTEAFVTGWGRIGYMQPLPEKLQLLYVNVISTKQCFEGIEKASEGWYNVPPHDPETEICTLHSFGHGMCHGDSGSALVQADSQKQIGIVSWGFPCALNAPDVFTRISGFKSWLQQTINEKRIH